MKNIIVYGSRFGQFYLEALKRMKGIKIMGGIDLKQTLTRKQEESYQCILNYTKEHGYLPTVREFGKLIGVRSTSSAFSRIKQLEQNGYIRRLPASPRAIEIL